MKSGQSPKKVRKWKFEDQMGFLKHHFQERSTLSNVALIDDSIDIEIQNVSVDDESDTQTKKLTPDRGNKRFKPCEESASAVLMKYILANKIKQPAETHPVDAFLSGISATMKSFTPYYQNIAKQKIFSAISELELHHIGCAPNPNQPRIPTPDPECVNYYSELDESENLIVEENY